MKNLTIVLLFLLSLSTVAQDKISLFNGKNLDGWKMIVEDQSIAPASIFKAEDGVIKVSGVTNGYLRTKEVYTNYQLHLEWRWTEKPSNSGVLLHVNGYDFWPNAIESQLQDQHAGDIVLIGYGVSGIVRDSSYINTNKRFTIVPKLNDGIEKPAGEWNSYDITCNEDQVTIFVNGVLQNEGKKLSLTGGSIGLQSEGSPIEFRNIKIMHND
ncbi:MAG: DUF1080 domain-containing protein [Prolixibacteraceae bacterium]